MNFKTIFSLTISVLTSGGYWRSRTERQKGPICVSAGRHREAVQAGLANSGRARLVPSPQGTGLAENAEEPQL